MAQAPIISFTVTWHAFNDACPKCQTLNNYVWKIPEVLETTLIHPTFGDVYDFDADVSLTHPNCRCWVEIEPEFTLENDPLYSSFLSGVAEFSGAEMPSNYADVMTEIEEFEKRLGTLDNRLDNTQFAMQQTLLLLHRMRLPSDVNRVMWIMIRAKMVAEGWARSLELLTAASLASGPWGWITAGIAMAVTVVTTSDLIMDAGNW
jgi:hypothetical protein